MLSKFKRAATLADASLSFASALSDRLCRIALMICRIGLLSGVCFLPAAVSADTIFGIHASAHIWKPELSGSIGQQANGFDFSSEFSDDKGSSNSLLVAVEHPIPLIPNVQVRQTPLTWKGSGESATGTLLGSVTLEGQVAAEFDLDSLDGTLYYEVLDNWVSLDLGLTARRLDGFFAATDDQGRSDRVEVDQTLPMLYGHVRFDLPFTGLAAGVRGNAIAYQESNLTDLEAYLHLEVDLIPLLDLGIQGGLRRLSLDIDDVDDWNSEATMEGAYVAVTGHF